MPLAINDKGDALYLDQNNQWSPAPRATNNKGDTLLFDGSAWVAHPSAAKPKMPAANPRGRNFAADFENVLTAAEQGTTPNLSAQSKNFLGEGTIDEEGNLLIKGPGGQLTPTDTSKHVQLTDPSSGKVLVFQRSGETEESPITGLSRVVTSGLGANAPSRVAGGIQAVNPAVQAAERLNIAVPRAVASEGRTAPMAAQALQNVPFTGNRISKKVGETIEGLGQRTADVAQEFGGQNAQGAGSAAQSALERWIGPTSKAKVADLYDKVDYLVDPSVTTPLTNTQKIARVIKAERGEARLGSSRAVDLISEAANDTSGLTWDGIKALRTRVGEMLDNPSLLPAETSGAELKRVYGALTKDLQAAAFNAGGKAGAKAAARASRYNALVQDRRESLMKILGTNDPAPEAIFNRLASMAGSSQKADIGRLAQARKAMGADAWNEFASGVVGQLGGGAEQFSPAKFVTAYGKLAPEAKSILFKSTGRGDLAQHLDDIAEVSSKWKNFEKLSNPSGTARNVLGPLAGYSFLADPVSVTLAVVGGRGLARILSNPASAASMSRFGRAYSAFARKPSATTMAGVEVAARNLSHNAPGLNPADLIRTIQGSMKAPAQDEQQ